MENQLRIGHFIVKRMISPEFWNILYMRPTINSIP